MRRCSEALFQTLSRISAGWSRLPWRSFRSVHVDVVCISLGFLCLNLFVQFPNMTAQFQEVPPPCSPSSFPLPAHVWTLCALQLCLPGSIVVPEQARVPVHHVSAPAGLKSSCSRSPSLRNDERSSLPPQAIQPLDRRPSGAGEHVCFTAAQSSSAADKAGHYVQFYPTAINRQRRRTS